MQVKNAMNKKITCVDPDTSIYDVAKILFNKHIRCLPVITKDKKLLGIIRDSNIFRQLYPHYHEYIVDFSSHNYSQIERRVKTIAEKKAKDIMTKDYSYVFPDDPLIKALSMLLIRDHRQLPVVDDDKKIIGIITQGDIFDRLFKTYLKNAS